MKPINVTNDSFAEYNEYSNKKDPKFKVGNPVRISKYKSIFAKEYAPNQSEEVLIINKIKNAVRWTYVINDLIRRRYQEYYSCRYFKLCIKN